MNLVGLMTNNFDVRTHILSHIRKPRDFWSLCYASKAFGSSMMSERCKINNILQPFVKDPRKFRSLQGATDAFLTGSIVNRLVNAEQSAWVPDILPLSIWVPKKSRARWTNFLIDEGYRLVSTVRFQTNTGLQIVFERDKTTVFLLCTSCPVKDLLRACTITFEVAIITWDSVFVLFPRETFVEEKGYLLAPIRPETGKAMRTYNWDYSKICCQCPPHPINYKGWNICSAHRTFEDEWTWIIPLDTSELESPAHPMDFKMCEFAIIQADWGGVIVTSNFTHALLRHQYATITTSMHTAADGSRTVPYGDFVNLRHNLKEYLDQSLPWKLLMLQHEQRPPGVITAPTEDPRSITDNWIQTLNLGSGWNVPPSWTPPPGFTFMDDEIALSVRALRRERLENKAKKATFDELGSPSS